jgi:Integrase core domain
VVLRDDNGTQFTFAAYRDAAAALQLTLSRDAFRHPDGNAFIERPYLSLKTECVWPEEFNDYQEALAVIQAWVLDCNHALTPTKQRPERQPRQGSPRGGSAAVYWRAVRDRYADRRHYAAARRTRPRWTGRSRS